MNIGAQLRVYDVEDATKVPAKFRFPFYKRMNWYAARYYHDLLQGTFTKDMSIYCTAKTVLFPADQGTKSVLSKYELEGLNSLAQWLKKDIQSGSRKDIPHDIHDPSALLSQLISMVENEMEKQQIPKRKRSDSTDSLGNETDDHVKREGDDDDDDLVREKLETASLAKRRKSIGKEQTGAS